MEQIILILFYKLSDKMFRNFGRYLTFKILLKQGL